MRTKLAALLWSLSLIVLVTIMVFLQAVSSFNIESNVLKLLPKEDADSAVELAFESFSEINMKQLVFLVQNEDIAQAKKSADSLLDSLTASPWIEEVIASISTQEQEEIGRFNYNFRYHLLTEQDSELLKSGAYENFSDTVIQQAYSAFSGGVVSLIETDPFLLSYRFSVENSENELKNFTLDDGYLISRADQSSSILLRATLVQSPFNQTLQEQLMARIASVEQAWQTAGNDSRLIRTGALFYTEFAYSSARNEITFIGGSSLLLILFMIITTFLSIRPVLLVALALSFGILLGFVSVRLLFGEVHLLTFVFGASLIGVAVDYAFHYFAVAECKTGDQRLKRIFPAITLGLCSSVIAYFALLLTPFPGLQQMAVFCIAGLLGAYLTVIGLFPVIPFTNTCSKSLLFVCQKLLRFGAKKRAPTIIILGLVLPFIAAYLVFTNESPVDDIRQFQSFNANLQTQESVIKNALNSPAANQFYLVKGVDEEALLINLEKASQSLDALVASAALESYVSISKWLPSIQKQTETYSLYQGLFESDAIVSVNDSGLLTDTGYKQAKDVFIKENENYLYPTQWLNSALGKQYSSLWLGKINDEYASVIAIRGINDLSVLDNFDDNSLFVDKVSTISILLASYRQSTSLLLIVAAIFIFIVLGIRYGFRKAGIMISSPLISVSATVVGLAMMGEAFSLFNVLALFLVVGIGIDFGIFFVESKEASSNTLLAVFLSALTTIFSFGLLSLSSTAVIHSFGLTMLIGISMALLLSPIIGNLIVSEKRGSQ